MTSRPSTLLMVVSVAVVLAHPPAAFQAPQALILDRRPRPSRRTLSLVPSASGASLRESTSLSGDRV